jgi:hypothetical protein
MHVNLASSCHYPIVSGVWVELAGYVFYSASLVARNKLPNVKPDRFCR